MRPLRVFLAPLVGFVRRAQRERAFDEELESHLQLHIDDNVRAGMPPDEARRRALARLGGLTATRQAYHERGTLLLLEHTLQDVQQRADGVDRIHLERRDRRVAGAGMFRVGSGDDHGPCRLLSAGSP